MACKGDKNPYSLWFSSKFPSPEFESFENSIGEGGNGIGCWLSTGWGNSRSVFSTFCSWVGWLMFRCDPLWECGSLCSIEKWFSSRLSFSARRSRIVLYSRFFIGDGGAGKLFGVGGDGCDVSSLTRFSEPWDVSPLVVGTLGPPRGEVVGDCISVSIWWLGRWQWGSLWPFIGRAIRASLLLISRLRILNVLILICSFRDGFGGELISGGSMCPRRKSEPPSGNCWWRWWCCCCWSARSCGCIDSNCWAPLASKWEFNRIGSEQRRAKFYW